MEGDDPTRRRICIPRREPFRGVDIKIPKVLHRDRNGWRKLDHLQDILAEVDWDEVRLPSVQMYYLHDPPYMHQAEVDVDQESPLYSDKEELEIDKTLRVSWFTRRLSDVVPNPWRAAQFVFELFDRLKETGRSEEDIFDNRAGYAEQLKTHLRSECDRLSKAIFEKKLKDGLIQFDLYTEPIHRLPPKLPLRVSEDDKLLTRYGEPVQMSLFDKVFEKQFDSDLEENFAFHLEKQPLQWWHRNQREYYVLGWRRERIYPDFVAFGDISLNIFETKGGHLRDNPDTKYKTEVFELLEQHFNRQNSPVRVEEHKQRKGKFAIVYESEFPAVHD